MSAREVGPISPERMRRLLSSGGVPLQQGLAPIYPLIVEDLGTHTNPERWLHTYHWECDEVTIVAIGAGGQQLLGAVVPAGVARRIREITIRHTGTANTVVSILVVGAPANKVTIDVPAQTTRVWSSQDGLEFAAGEQPAAQTSDVTGGGTIVSARGVEA